MSYSIKSFLVLFFKKERASFLRTRIEYVDGLRAIAVLLVFVTHATEIFHFGPITGGTLLGRICYGLNFGRVGVVTFFAISGFVIPASLRGARGVAAKRFLVNRLCRLFPAYWASLVPAVLTYPLIWHYSTGGHRMLLPSEIAANATMLPALLGFPLANGAYWTLAIELFFYAFCLFLFAGNLLHNVFLLMTASFFMFALFFSSQQELWGGLLNPVLDGDTFFFFLHLSVMFWGAVCRRWWDGERLEPIPAAMFWSFNFYWFAYMPVKGIFPALVGFTPDTVDTRLIAGYSIGLGLFFAGLLLHWPKNRLLAWTGKISFSFYLLHGPCLYVMVWVTLHVAALRGIRAEWCLLATLLACTALSALLYYLVEKPAIALGHRIAFRIGSRQPAHSLT